IPAALSCFRAATASSTVSPATKRAAKRRARPFRWTNLKTRGCSLSQRRPARSTRCWVSGVRCQVSGIELGAAARLLLQHLAGGEARAVALGEPLQLGHESGRAQVVRVAERAATERWEAEAEDGPDVAVARGAHHAVADRPRGLVQHAVHEALQDLGEAGAAVGGEAEQPPHRGGHAPPLGAPLAADAPPPPPPPAARLPQPPRPGGRPQPP